MQTVGIRRIIDKSSLNEKKNKENEKRAVISLPKIIQDISNHIDLITRENYICYNGLPYELTPESDDLNKLLHNERHKNFDLLAATEPGMRSRGEFIKVDILYKFKKEIDKCENVKTIVDKFIAHAAAPETIKLLSAEEKSVTLAQLKSYHIIIYQVARFISYNILSEAIGGLPVPQYNLLENLDKKWGDKEDLEQAQEKWDEFGEEIRGWQFSSH